MNPLRISARNYRAFESLDLEIPSGCIAVVGDNGAGKSSIVNVIDLALFGTRSLGDYLSEVSDDTEMEILLDFEHDGETYRVRRTFSARGRGKTTLDFEVAEAESGHAEDQFESGSGFAPSDEAANTANWPESGNFISDFRPLTREDQKQTQALIEQTIGFSREAFRASAFLAEGDAGAFTEAQPRDRKRILCEVLGLGIWDELLEQARREVSAIKATTDRLSLQIEEADLELATKDGVAAQHDQCEADLTQAQGDLTDAETAHKAAQENLAASREVAAKLEAAREVSASREREVATQTTRLRQVETILSDSQGLPKLKAESEALAGRRESIEADLAAAKEAEAARAEHRRLTTERDRLVNEAHGMTERVVQLRAQAQALLDHRDDEEAQRCSLCEQVLGLEAATTSAVKLNDQADELGTQATKLEGEAETLLAAIELTAEGSARGPNAAKQAELQNTLKVSIEAGRTLATIAEREKTVEGLKVERNSIDEKLTELEPLADEAAAAVRKLEADAPKEDLEAAVARAYGTLIEARSVHTSLSSSRDVAKAELERLAKIEERVVENRRAMAERQGELALLQLEERVYGRDGIPVFILENTAIPALEVEAQRILSRLGGKTAAARIELRTQRALKSGDGLKESLDIVLFTSEGGERAYEFWSRGERMRINLALRLALANVLAHRRGAESQVFVLDEPDALDVTGKSALIELLREVHGRGIDKVLLVSHDPDLRDAFDESIEVELVDETTSRVKGAELAEALA